MKHFLKASFYSLIIFSFCHSALAATFVVNSNLDAVDDSPGDGQCFVGPQLCTLRAAIMEANALSGADVIEIATTGPFHLTLTGTAEDACLSGDLDITEDLTITSATPYIVNASAVSERVFHVIGSPVVDITLATITGGYDSDGGGVYNEGSLALNQSRVTANESSSYGGGIYSKGGSSLNLQASFVKENIAANDGGGIYIESGVSADFQTGTAISDNQSYGKYGGGVFSASDLSLDTATISKNKLSSSYEASGGGIYMESSTTLNVVTSLISLNTAETSGASSMAMGGGIYSEDTVNLENTKIRSNSVTGPFYAIGGGLSVVDILTISGSVISQNTATSDQRAYGGGLSSDTSLNMEDSIVYGNSVSASYAAYSGGVDSYGSETIISDSQISYNQVSGAGAVAGNAGASLETDTVQIERTKFTNNKAIGTGTAIAYGGGLLTMSETVILDEIEIASNFVSSETSNAWAGGYYASTGTNLTMTNSAIYDNKVIGPSDKSVSGGGIEFIGTSATIVNSTISQNSLESWTKAELTYPGSGGGGLDLYGKTDDIYIYNTTIVRNKSRGKGGGLMENVDGVYIQNSLVASNTSMSDGPDCYSSDLYSLGNNLISDTDGCDYVSGSDDITGSSSSGATVDPRIYPLAYNGGFTKTHALRLISQAVDAGSNCETEAGPYDQRGSGYDRTFGSECDIGAYEAQ